jgi:Fe-Mn family superoxide dismutase
MTIRLPDLPYAYEALEPHVSATTLHFHHDKHHKGYVDKANGFLEDSPLKDKHIEDIVRGAYADGDQALFNNIAQVWNHTVYWHSMTPDGGGDPHGELAKKIAEDFGDAAKFRKKFKEVALDQFGSGYAWLAFDSKKLIIEKTPNAVTPLIEGKAVLLSCDVWEHAYYLDHQNRRDSYVDAFLNHLVNWHFAEERFGVCTSKGRTATFETVDV